MQSLQSVLEPLLTIPSNTSVTITRFYFIGSANDTYLFRSLLYSEGCLILSGVYIARLNLVTSPLLVITTTQKDSFRMTSAEYIDAENKTATAKCCFANISRQNLSTDMEAPSPSPSYPTLIPSLSPTSPSQTALLSFSLIILHSILTLHPPPPPPPSHPYLPHHHPRVEELSHSHSPRTPQSLSRTSPSLTALPPPTVVHCLPSSPLLLVSPPHTTSSWPFIQSHSLHHQM